MGDGVNVDGGRFAVFLRSMEGAPVWVACSAYVRAVLDSDRCLPWSDVAELLGALQRRDQLIESDVIEISLLDFITDWLDVNPKFVELARGKARITAPLRILLAQEDLRAQLRDVLAAVAATFARRALVLTTVAPSTLLRLVWERCHGTASVEFDLPYVEAAAAYLADLLREIGSATLAGVLVVHDAEFDSADCRSPVVKVARFRGWSYGMRLCTQPAPHIIEDLDFVITADPVDAPVLWGRSFGPAYWRGDDAADIGRASFVHTEIPATADPGRVLERIAALRAAAAHSTARRTTRWEA